MRKLLFAIMMAATPAMAQINLSSGLNAYYKFSGNFRDSSGKGHHGNAQNGVNFTKDRWGNANSAANFDGVDDWVSIASTGNITAKSKLTMCFHYKSTSTNGQVLLSKSEFYNNASNRQFQVGINYKTWGGDGVMLSTDHDLSCSNITFSHYSFSKAVLDTNWHCVIVSFDSSYKKIYVDGILLARDTVKLTANNFSLDSCSGDLLKLGVWWDYDPQWFKGQMDEIRIYKRILNPEELDSVCKQIKTVPVDTNTSIENITAQNTYDIYPNPAKDVLYLESETGQDVYITITDVAGRVMQRHKASGTKISLPVSELHTGVYILTISNDEGIPLSVKRFYKSE